MIAPLYTGCAGWSLRETDKPSFPTVGSHLERYAGVFNAVEVNSSFYRSHRRSTWERWGGSTPDAFRFSVKLPRTITHERRLDGGESLVQAFLDEVGGLGRKLGPILIQLPPSLAWDAGTVDRFFTDLRQRHPGPLVCEPRHPTWFTEPADAMLRTHRVGLAAVDPAPKGATPLTAGGFPGLVYMRLHGSPKIYYSGYSEQMLARLAVRLTSECARAAEVWCIFDNTAEGHAIPNALALRSFAQI